MSNEGLIMTATNWRPMSTAPKDGTRILIASKHAEVVIADWEAETNDWYVNLVLFGKPVAWQPLPTYDHERDKP